MIGPWKFRTRVLAALMAVGTCLMLAIYYGGLPPEGRRFLREPAGQLWTLLWSAPRDENCPPPPPVPESARPWLNTADVYPKLDFAVPDNGGLGFWDDALEKRYRAVRENWKNLPLKVIVVPHSHVDPGWLRTFDDYHVNTVTRILDNMVDFLNRTEDFKFIWSEISFFARWWDRQSESTRSTVRQLVRRKQLEFLTGGWVMPDEAVTSYFAVIDQLVEGHQWLAHSVGVSPRRGWSVDVFGHSATYPLVLSAAGISDVVVMRTHYAWKSFLAEAQSLDFRWRQPLSTGGAGVLCHMAPSDLYSFKYACGPDPVVCLKYDFRRVDREYSESTADRITDANVEARAGQLLSQYGRFASLYPHNVLLVPLGDDFRYDVDVEWVQQHQNYGRLFDFINGKKEWNAHVQFGTVSDYFDEVDRRLRSNASRPLKSIEGDFLPYADVYADSRPSYWTGFYTTRPFYKKLSRELEHWLRTSEILYSLAKTVVPGRARKIMDGDYAFLVSARQTLALFQHHDAITGTSKGFVMRDYGQKLHAAILDAMSVASHVTQLMLMEQPSSPEDTWTSQVYPDAYRSAFDQPTRKLTLSVPDGGRKIILFNSLAVGRAEVVRLKVKSALVKVVDSSLRDVPCQVNPVFKDGLSISNAAFELLFVATLGPLAYGVYTVVELRAEERPPPRTVVSVSLNSDALGSHVGSAFAFEEPPTTRDITFESRSVVATFSHRGLLRSVHLKESGLLRNLDVDFLTYHPWMYRSGAYLFNPDTVAVPVRNQSSRFPLLAVIRGPLMSELTVAYDDFLKVSVRLYDFEGAPAALQLECFSDVSKMREDVELVVRLKADVENSGVFYTDSNGFQMLRRRRVPHLPVQGNYYPATSALYVEDGDLRLNVLLPHSHGVTAPSHDGEVEVLLDRKVRRDDGRGMGEGLLDSRGTSTLLWILPESPQVGRGDAQLSSEAFWLSKSLLHPPTILVSEHSGTGQIIGRDVSFLGEGWPLSGGRIHLVNLRTLHSSDSYLAPSNNSLMIVHQRRSCGSSSSFVDRLVKVRGQGAFSSPVKVKSVVRTLLTGVEAPPGGREEEESPPPLQACKITFGE